MNLGSTQTFRPLQILSPSDHWDLPPSIFIIHTLFQITILFYLYSTFPCLHPLLHQENREVFNENVNLIMTLSYQMPFHGLSLFGMRTQSKRWPGSATQLGLQLLFPMTSPSPSLALSGGSHSKLLSAACAYRHLKRLYPLPGMLPLLPVCLLSRYPLIFNTAAQMSLLDGRLPQVRVNPPLYVFTVYFVPRIQNI